jgi:CRP/FNR family transcriptional regulator
MATRMKKTMEFTGSARHFGDGMQDNRDQGVLESTTLSSRKQKRFAAKEVIYLESDRVERLYLIRNGMVKLLSYLPNGRARIIRLHAKGHWMGLEGLTGQAYEHTAIAVGDVEVELFPIQSIQRLEREDPRQLGQLLRQWHGDLAQADRWISDFSTGGIKPRVARLLEFLSKIEYGESSHMVELLTVHEMADMLGVTPESVSRILAEFKRNHILHRQEYYSDETYEIDSQKLQYEARQ